MNNIYTFLRSSQTVSNISDYYCEDNELTTVTINGVEMSIDEFRRLRPSKYRNRGMGGYMLRMKRG